MSQATHEEAADESRLVGYLISLATRHDRGALAALRSGVGKRPGEATRMLPLIARFLPPDREGGPWVEACFVTASLFATHPKQGKGTLGASLRAAVEKKHGEPGVAARLSALLDAHPDDVARHLTGLVGLCESAGVPINWNDFLDTVYDLLSPDETRRDRVRLRLARDFYRSAGTDAETETP